MFRSNHFKKSLILSASALLIGGAFVACSKSSSDDGSSTGGLTSLTDFPIGLAIASLTSSSSTVYTQSTNDVGRLTVSSDDSFAEKIEAISDIATASTETSCQVILPNMSSSSNNPSCYGPQLYFINHINATADDGNSVVAGGELNSSNGDDGQFPGGDLGIWSSTESGSGEACVSAKFNSLVQSVASKVDASMLALASAKCVMTANSIDFPTEGNTTDITSALLSSLSANNSGLTLSAASVERLTDVNSNPVYKYSMTFATGGTTATVYMKHSPTNSDGSQYIGRIWAQFSGSQNSAFSLSYEKSTELKAQMTTAGFPNFNTSPFNSDGSFKLNGTWDGNISQTLISIDPTTFSGNASYAWQAGSGDSHARVFNVNVDSGTNSGCGFYGFGPKFDNTTTTLPNNSIGNFICNWAGPQNSHTGLSGKAQKQCFSLSGGIYAPTTSNITYAPTNSCDKASGAGLPVNSPTALFKYGLVNATWDTDDSHTVTNNLVTLSSDSDFTNYSAPAAPSLPNGF